MVQNKNNLELEIILVLLKNKTHLREIARILNESHSTILRKINDLIKENVLDYKKEGKNKVFFIKNNLKAKNYIYSAEIHKLNNLLKKHSELSVIFEDIKKKVKDVHSKLSIKIGKFDTKSLLIKEIIKNHIIIRGLEDFYERTDFFKET